MKMINGWPGDVELPLAKGEKKPKLGYFGRVMGMYFL